MFITKNEAPADFIKRYERIMSGKEKLDSIAKLKEFWLFAIEQGMPNREMRECIAHHVEDASWKSDKIIGNRSFLAMNSFDTTGLMSAFDMWQSFKAMNPAPNSTDQTDEEYIDERWQMILEEIERIKI